MNRPFHLQVQELNDRIVPSISLLDLTKAGATASAGGAIVRQDDTQPTGTGHIQSFVRLQSPRHRTGVQHVPPSSPVR